MKKNNFLKVTGILMIIFGCIGAVIGLIAALGTGALAAFLGPEANLGLLVLSSILTLLSGVASFIAGIIGVKNAGKPEKAQTCIVWGIITAGFAVFGSILNVAGGNKFSLSSLLIGLVIPVLYLIGAFQNKKAYMDSSGAQM